MPTMRVLLWDWRRFIAYLLDECRIYAESNIYTISSESGFDEIEITLAGDGLY